MHLEIYRNRPDVERRRARAPADRDRVCRGRHPAHARRAGGGGHDARQHPDCGIRDAVDRGAARRGAQVHQGSRRLLLANHGAVTCCRTVMTAYYKMETIEHFAKISLVARLLGRRAPDFTRRSGAAAGASRHVRHCGAGAVVCGSVGARRRRPGSVSGARSAGIAVRAGSYQTWQSTLGKQAETGKFG